MVQHAETLAPMRELYLFKRGLDLPQTKLTPFQIMEIRAAVDKRRELREYIAENWSNAALAKRLGVHQRTVEKVIHAETHFHVR